MIVDLWPVPLWNVLAQGVFASSPVQVVWPLIQDDSVAGQRAYQCVYQLQVNG